MPLYQDPETGLEEKPDVVPEIETTTIYQGVEEVEVSTSLEGSDWAITYFSQYLGEDDTPRRLDNALDPSLQQYVKIKNYNLKVTGELDTSIGDYNISTTSGSANMWPGVPPNRWDMFVGRMSDGMVGLFTITEQPQPLNFNRYSAWSVEYELVGYIDNEHADAIDLEVKTIRTTVFNDENPGCPGEAVNAAVTETTIRERISELLSSLYEQSYDLKSKTLLYTDSDNRKWYDGQVVDFIRSMVSFDMLGRRPMPVGYSTPSGEYEQTYETIYDVLRHSDWNRSSWITDSAAKVNTGAFSSEFILSGIFMLTHVSGCLHPGDNKVLATGLAAGSEFTYVFRPAFYTETTLDMTPLELDVYKVLKGETIDLTAAFERINNIYNWTEDEVFFHVPVYIWLLLKHLS